MGAWNPVVEDTTIDDATDRATALNRIARLLIVPLDELAVTVLADCGADHRNANSRRNEAFQLMRDLLPALEMEWVTQNDLFSESEY